MENKAGYGYGNTAELAEIPTQKKYEPFKLDSNRKAIASMQIKCKSGSVLFFPYSHAVLTELKKEDEGHHTMILMGGGEVVTLHLRNFAGRIYDEFCDAFADHKIKYIFELPDDLEAGEEPYFTVKVDDLARR